MTLEQEKSVIAVLHFVNTSPTDWYSKRHATVETATYGSEFVAAKTAPEQIMDLRNTLRYLGVPIMTKAYSQLSPAQPYSLWSIKLATCNFSSRANPKTRKNTHRLVLYIEWVLFAYTLNVSLSFVQKLQP